jgi:hypothetical protein
MLLALPLISRKLDNIEKQVLVRMLMAATCSVEERSAV